jgi:hypothetical protein
VARTQSAMCPRTRFSVKWWIGRKPEVAKLGTDFATRATGLDEREVAIRFVAPTNRGGLHVHQQQFYCERAINLTIVLSLHIRLFSMNRGA